MILCPMLGRVIVLVRDDQLSLAIGKKGQNVRLASKLVGWDIEVMTRDELDEQLERSVTAFSEVPHVTEDLAESLVSQGFFNFDDLSVIEPEHLVELSGLTAEECDEIIAHADVESLRQEKEEKAARAAGRAASRSTPSTVSSVTEPATEMATTLIEPDTEPDTEQEQAELAQTQANPVSETGDATVEIETTSEESLDDSAEAPRE